MKPFEDSKGSSSRKRPLKHHVERRRRERINRSLDNLKSLLLLPQEATQRRVEKAEILEHTVLFLQKTRDKNRSEAGGGSQKDSFQEGFSDCMERAVRFLGPMGKGLCLRAVLDPSASARSSSSDFGSANWKNRSEVHPSSSSQLLRRSCKSLLHLWLHKPANEERSEQTEPPPESPSQPFSVEALALSTRQCLQKPTVLHFCMLVPFVRFSRALGCELCADDHRDTDWDGRSDRRKGELYRDEDSLFCAEENSGPSSPMIKSSI
ncbi:Transcription factor HES-7.1 Hairy and enhancer of split 7.1 [Takifugu flavidus]|uniref:Transcription factor HES-7.1 Hairy and enhancer of split 7.1 n=1 Tax=Takifugu flavidus TaxID=433684 RepID=A0A5C6PJS1_9TELE|nr:Transcription factor HES-7.1 Hairy and enhancer of split 7.1 [Takifugu flavidus]